MKDRPILFSGPMVRAIQLGQKTQTRRVIKPQPSHLIGFRGAPHMPAIVPDSGIVGKRIDCPYGEPGGRLWVRETWAAHWMYDDVRPIECRSGNPGDNYWFRSDPEGMPGSNGCPSGGRIGKWRPSIFMPRWVCRIVLDVVDVRVEPLQEISEEDAAAEGCLYSRHPDSPFGNGHAKNFRCLWDSINAGRGFAWSTNPWVWVVTFRLVEGDA